MLHELSSSSDISSFLSTNANSLICFSATWCGPCTASKPMLVALAAEYDPNVNSVVKLQVGIVYEHTLGNDLQQYSVRAFPTYILWENNGRNQVGRVAGANFDAIRSMISKLSNPMGSFGGGNAGEGHSLGVGNSGSTSAAGSISTNLNAQDLRLQRLAKMQAVMNDNDKQQRIREENYKQKGEEDKSLRENETNTCNVKSSTGADAEMKDAIDDKKAEGSQNATDEKEPGEVEMIDPTASLDRGAIDQLTNAMGFPLIRAQKGLLNGGGSAEGAVEWLLSHQDDENIDEPIELIARASVNDGSGPIAQSYKCNECGKVLSNMANLELHANKTGHSDFEESTQAVKQLTAEEKAAKVVELKGLLAAKRAEREEEEKQEDIDREKSRRFMGKEMLKTREQMEAEQRRRDVQQRKREKEAAKRERDRIRAELAKDKAERMANKGKLPGRLGVDGYQPDGIQYDVGGDEGTGEVATEQESTAAKSKKNARSNMKVDECITKVSQYRAGGDGGKCLKVLHAYIKNVAEADDEKFKTINMENKVFKTKVKPFIGGKQLLLDVGFAPNESGDALVLSDDADKGVLKETVNKLEKAMAAY